MPLNWIWRARFIFIPAFMLATASLALLAVLCFSTPASYRFPFRFSAKPLPFQPAVSTPGAGAERTAPVMARSVPEARPRLAPVLVRQRRYWPLIRDEARRRGLDPILVMGLVQTESSFNPYAVSNKGAVGLMQINRPTAEHLGLKDPLDPQANLKAGIRYLAWLKKLFKGDMVLTLAAYNAGPTKVLETGRVPNHKETRAFVRRVFNEADLFRQQYMSLARK